MRKSICFAYYADGQFLGWYSDSFGTISKNSPKLYGYSEEQLKIITSNFSAKVKKAKGLQDDDFLSVAAKTISHFNPTAAAMMVEKKSPLQGYNEIELRIVECPEYDGPDPDFDKEAYEKEVEVRREKLKVILLENGIEWESGPSYKRLELVEKFEKENPYSKRSDWIYADYTKVKEWANNEPTVFLEVIKPEL